MWRYVLNISSHSFRKINVRNKRQPIDLIVNWCKRVQKMPVKAQRRLGSPVPHNSGEYQSTILWCTSAQPNILDIRPAVDISHSHGYLRFSWINIIIYLPCCIISVHMTTQKTLSQRFWSPNLKQVALKRENMQNKIMMKSGPRKICHMDDTKSKECRCQRKKKSAFKFLSFHSCPLKTHFSRQLTCKLLAKTSGIRHEEEVSCVINAWNANMFTQYSNVRCVFGFPRHGRVQAYYHFKCYIKGVASYLSLSVN